MCLTLEERGAYQTLLDMIYDRGGPLIDNERLLAGYMNCSIRKWRQIRDQLIQKGKIRITKDGLLTNKRAEKEIENQSKTHRKLIEAGSKGGRIRVENEKKPNEISESGQALLKPASSDPQAIPEARSHSVDKSTAGKPAQNDPVKSVFDLGLLLLAEAGVDDKRARSLLGKWRKGKGDAKVIEVLLECRNKSIADPVEWLTKRLQGARWVSPSGYEYRGSDEQVLSEAEKRHDMDTYWRVHRVLKERAA
jgi:uncharacterized protein YdaU (DUF1376 family)